MLGSMLLVVAAMKEELEHAMALCQGREKISERNVIYWKASRGEKQICFFRTGVGPRRSAENMELVLNVLSPAYILLIGYAGALDPGLKLGDLVGVQRALACSMHDCNRTLDHLQLDRQFELRDADVIVDSAKSIELRAGAGDTLTSAYVLGVPQDKKLLYQKYGASIVDMETAAVAAVADSRNIPLGCVRAISDEAEDAFLAPFSYDPSTNLASRAVKIVGSGIQSYQEWKAHSKTAGEALARFLSLYL
jgi:adenosylhomocysteine nucleosidase